MSWILGLVGTGGLLWVALALFAPSVLQALMPVFQGLGNAVVELGATLWRGLKWMLGSVDGIIFTSTVVVLALMYGKYWLSDCSPTVVYKEKSSISKPSTNIEEKTLDIFHRWFQ